MHLNNTGRCFQPVVQLSVSVRSPLVYIISCKNHEYMSVFLNRFTSVYPVYISCLDTHTILGSAHFWFCKDIYNIFKKPPGAVIKLSYLHSSGVPGRVGAHLEESSLSRGRLTSVSGRPSLVHHHGLSSEQTHQMGWLFPLHHPHLVKTNAKVRTWKNHKTLVAVLMSFAKQTRAL